MLLLTQNYIQSIIKKISFFLLMLISCHIKCIANDLNLFHASTQEIVIDIEEDQAHKEKVLKEIAKKKFLESINKQEIPLLEESFNQAPIEVKALIHAMLKGETFATRFKNILLSGPSGSGKSTLAKAIAYKLQKRCIIVRAPDLLGHYRDQAAENIRKLFKEVTEADDKPVLILDEMNALTDDHTSEHSDTKHTAMQLWTLLDKHAGDKDFLFIGTTNITKKMPHQLQSRFEGKTFFIDSPSLQSRCRALQFLFEKLKIERDESCTNSYFNELAEKTADFSMRRLEAMIDKSLLLYSIKYPDQPIKKISKDLLEQAYAQIVHDKEKLWDFKEQVTDEERRHKENMALSAKQAEENRELQIKLTEWNMLYQGFRELYRRSEVGVVKGLNNTKKYIFPDKKPALKIVIIPGTPGFFGEPDEEKIEVNHD